MDDRQVLVRAGSRYLRINFMDDLYTVDTWSAYLGSLYDIGFRDTRFGVVIGNFGPTSRPSASRTDNRSTSHWAC